MSTTNTATYSPEDNKLRLYVGRVPRDEYLKLRAEGWTSTPKQDCDFVATWTPERRNTALEYADLIEDEDQGPEDRAADRAERFGEYRNKRTLEATGHADRYDSGPSAHGYQSAARAERSARRHDRIAGYACDAWSKAEYWQRRTAGVISHALYKSTPGVRMGRIKTLEAELRKTEKSNAEYAEKFETWRNIAAITDPQQQTEVAERFAGAGYNWSKYVHPRTGKEGSLWDFLRKDATDRITGAEAAALYMAKHRDPLKPEFQETTICEWINHYKLRLAYENQMLEAQGGRLEQCEVVPGGKLGGKLIIKVSKSTVTGRATSADIIGPKVQSWTYKACNIPGTEFAAYKFDLERLAPNAYTPPTPESLAELAAFKASVKASAPKKTPCPLINPTDADAERLQALWNARATAKREEYYKRQGYKLPVSDCKPQTVIRTTQANYSAQSKGAYARAETRAIFKGGFECDSYYNAAEKMREKFGLPICQLRRTHGETYSAGRIIILTDKPQKPLPAEVWDNPVLVALMEASESLA